MSDLTTLKQLARFSARSPLASANHETQDAALAMLARSFEPSRPVRRRVSDLLAVVMTLSARTRRMVLPKVDIEIDVFAPGGKRAVRMFQTDRD